MTGGYRAGIVGVLLGLLAYVPATAQSGDTASATVADTSAVVGDSATGSNSVEPHVVRLIDDSVVKGWKDDKAYEYANDSSYWQWYAVQGQGQSGSRSYGGGPSAGSSGDQPSEGPLTRIFASKGFEYFILVLLGAILVFAIVRIIVANRLQLFYLRPKRLTVVKPGGEEDLTENDLEGQLTHFIQIKDYRQAVRYLYLKTLRLLSDREMIRYHPESTNHDYWQQLSATPQGRPFRDLITIYENVWYGEFPLGDALFIRLHQYYEEFYKSVRA
jgi:hypothetical protein